MLIQRGTLEVGDALVAGSHWGKVRAMHDYTGERVREAVPGDPVEVLGFDGVPDAGDTFRVVENDRTARQQANERAVRLRNEAQARRAGRKVSFDEVFRGIQEGAVQELNLVLKADVSGSLEAFEDEIARLPQSEVQVNVIRSGVGGINESDVMLAAASDAVILGFNVRPVGDARAVAEREGVEIRGYSVIYNALDDLRDAMQGMLAPEQVEETVGTVEVRATFRASRIGTIAGCYVTDGRVTRGAKVRVVRDGTVVYDTTIDSLKRFNDDVREVTAGFECGIVLANFQDVKEGDVLEVYETRQVERALGVARPPAAPPRPHDRPHGEPEGDVVGPLRRLRERADARQAPSDEPEVERRDAPARRATAAGHRRAPRQRERRAPPPSRTTGARWTGTAAASSTAAGAARAGSSDRAGGERAVEQAARRWPASTASTVPRWPARGDRPRGQRVAERYRQGDVVGRVRRAAAHPPAFPGLGQPQGQAQGPLVGQGAAARAPRRHRRRGRRPGHLAARDAGRRADRRIAVHARRVGRPRRALAARPLPGDRAHRAHPDVVRGRGRARMSGQRMRRVDEAMREVLGDALAQDLKDPRIGFVTVTDVKTSPDLRHARVYVSVLGDDRPSEATLDGLRSAHGFLQGRVAGELRLKRTPELRFELDETAARAARLERLIDEQAGRP